MNQMHGQASAWRGVQRVQSVRSCHSAEGAAVDSIICRLPMPSFLRSAASLLAGLAAVSCLSPLAMAAAANASGADIETVIMVRHGEKPPAGLGQLSCQGLNRALALPRVIASRYGAPDMIFAPDPAQRKRDVGGEYDYVRPLATVEPLAVRFGLPVNTQIGFGQTDALKRALLAPALRRSVVVVGWEHRILEHVARDLLAENGGDPTTVPRWESKDFDSIYLLHISRIGQQTKVLFTLEHQGLDGLSMHCPGS